MIQIEDESVMHFIERYQVFSKTRPHSHVRIEGGKYLLDYKVIDLFWNLYCDEFERNQNIIHSIAEQPSNDPKTFIPIIVDIDLKITGEDPMRLYSENDATTLIDIFQEHYRAVTG